MRRWLPPLCLLAVIAAVWALSPDSPCAAIAGEGPAIARVGGECVLLSHYADKLRVVEIGIEYAERELQGDDPYLNTLRLRQELVIRYGPETVALADAILDSVLFQRSLSEGHTPSDEEVADHRDRQRLRSESTADIIELAKLAERGDLAGARELVKGAEHPDIKLFTRDNGTLDLSDLLNIRESLAGPYMREVEESMEEWEAHLEDVGRERYWNEIFPAEARRALAVDHLQTAVMDASIDGPWEIPGMAWLEFQAETLSGIKVELTDAAPTAATADSAMGYLADLLEVERRILTEIYDRR